ncbi:serine hydrolase domain-containing protein [Mangrovimonas aestuarii]|uniref:serine hydrolase domain-containing protein n=1 Tax=Mangrovimonas aestuarii TaxID=3018443 RepID=UPI0023784E86|nr:serine hydrolase domain-containing protein [Mangrovimonas aestuarii]
MKISAIIKLTSFLFLCTISQTVFSQNSKIIADSIAMEHFKDSTNIGLSIGIIKNDFVDTYYYGGKYVREQKDIDSTTLFEIGSVTKLYTAYILASLETEEKIDRFDLLSKYLPDSVYIDKKWSSKIRLVDLATHISGLPQFESTKSLMNLEGFDENNPYGIFTESFMMRVLKETDTLNNYGQINYSNFGIGLLAYALEKSQNLSFEQLFEIYLIDKHNLENTFLKLTENELTDIAIPHRKSEKMPLIQLASLSPSGSIKTSMPDLLEFLELHIRKPKNVANVIDIVLQDQLNGPEQTVGLGWGIYKVENETVYFHNGGTYGSSSIVIIVPEKSVGIAILSNNSSDRQLTSYALTMIKKLIE